MDSHDTEDPKAEHCRYDCFCAKSTPIDAIEVPDNVGFHHYKVDEMGSRIDELEQSINDLRAEMGVEGPPSPSKPKDEPKPEDDAH